jgi:hypothetical protein
MNIASRQHRSWLLIILSSLVLFACTLSMPSFVSKTPGGTGQNPASSGSLLPDPGIGLSDLKSYHVSFHQDISGTLDGKPFEKHTHIELSRLGGQLDFVRELNGTDQPDSYFQVVATDQAVYRWNSVDETCQGEAGQILTGETQEPAALLLAVRTANKVGNETIDGIATVHYTFDGNALELSQPKPAIQGDLWLAEQGGYVVKYTLEAAMPSPATGTGQEAAQSWSYELSQVDTVEQVRLPAGCEAVPVDIPAMADAANVIRRSGFMEYSTASTAAQVVDLYYHSLDALGWKETQAAPSGKLKLPMGMLFTNGDERLAITMDAVDAAEGGGLDVNLFLYNPAELSAASTAESTSTPAATLPPSGPQPTIDPSKSGLPADVPLYPGATDLQKIGSALRFSVPDAPDLVATFYRQQMPANGWTSLQEANSGGQIIQTWMKADRIGNFIISVKDGKTSVMFSANK